MKFYTNVQPYRNSIFLRGYIDGEPFEEKVSYKPYLFIPSKLGNTKYSTLSGDKVDRIDFDSVYDAREFYKKYSQVNNFVVYGLDKFAYTCLYDNFPGVIEYDPQQIRVLNIDIEVAADEGFPDPAVANKEVTAITMSRSGKEIIALGCQEFNPPPNVKYYRCTDEVHLLQVFINLWNSKAYCPDVVTGWNVEFFDIPYLVNRIALLLGDAAVKKLSPWKIVEPKETMLNGKLSPTYNIFGITTLDYIAMYKKFMYTKLPSYKLDYVCHVELDERKMNYEEYDSLIDLYRKNFQLFMEYNIRDVELVDKLDAKLKLLELVYAMAYDGKVNYQDCLQSIRQWDVIIHNYLLDSNIVIPPLTHNDDSTSLVGGYVKVPQVGMHNWVCSFDLTSLYPHLIMEYNISQETFAGRLQHHIGIDGVLAGRLNDIREEFVSKDCAIAANLCMYTRKKQGFLPALMERMFEDRAVYKKQMIEEKNRLEHADPNDTELCDRIKREISRLDVLQLAKKIQLNSAYGSLGNPYFRWNDINNAEAITMSGQLAIRWIENKINGWLNSILKTDGVDYIIASDTDSVYISLGSLVEKYFPADADPLKITKFIDSLCKTKLEPFIDVSYTELAEYVNAYSQKMRMKREAIASKAIWTAKKRYILNLYDNEGVLYSEPKLKMVGIEAIKSSTPEAARINIRKAIELIMNKDEDSVIDFVTTFRAEFRNLPFDDIAFPRGINGMEKYADDRSVYSKGTPIQVKGALLFNDFIATKNFTKVKPIVDGEKIKFCYLLMPNPIRNKVISVPGQLPKEFGLEEYIDYETQFDKAFLAPVKVILDAIGWKSERTATLEALWT